MALTPVISDPTGERYGFPTYRWGDAPKHLMTRRELAKAGLRKGGQDPVAVMRHYVEGWQVAYLYDSHTALPRRPWTPARQAAVQKAADAKRKCGACCDPINPNTGECVTCGTPRIAPQELETAS